MSESNIPRLRDQSLTVRGGLVVSGGKNHYPDLVRLRIPADKALDFARELILAYQNHMRRGLGESEYLPEFDMFGQLEPVPDE